MDDRLQITFLGTGTSQGIPVIGSDHPVCKSDDPRDKRLRSSLLVSWNDYNYVIDCGPDFRQQMLVNPIQKLDGILFTHEHADHTAGLDDIRPFFFRQGDIPIFAHERVLESLKQRFDYIFADGHRYPGAPAIQAHRIDHKTALELGDKIVTVIEAWHNRIPVFGFRFNNFTYLTDVKKIEDKEIEKIKSSEVLVINALRIEAHHSHLNLDEALALVERIGAKHTYFTHISHLLGFHEVVEKDLPNNVSLAYDNLTISV